MFPCLLQLAWSSRPVLARSGESRHPYFFPPLEGESFLFVFNFHLGKSPVVCPSSQDVALQASIESLVCPRTPTSGECPTLTFASTESPDCRKHAFHMFSAEFLHFLPCVVLEFSECLQEKPILCCRQAVYFYSSSQFRHRAAGPHPESSGSQDERPLQILPFPKL